MLLYNDLHHHINSVCLCVNVSVSAWNISQKKSVNVALICCTIFYKYAFQKQQQQKPFVLRQHFLDIFC